MKEMEVGAGVSIITAAKDLLDFVVKGNEPAFCIFNGVRVETDGGQSLSQLVDKWHDDYAKNSRRVTEDRRAKTEFDAASAPPPWSPAGASERNVTVVFGGETLVTFHKPAMDRLAAEMERLRTENAKFKSERDDLAQKLAAVVERVDRFAREGA